MARGIQGKGRQTLVGNMGVTENTWQRSCVSWEAYKKVGAKSSLEVSTAVTSSTRTAAPQLIRQQELCLCSH